MVRKTFLKFHRWLPKWGFITGGGERQGNRKMSKSTQLSNCFSALLPTPVSFPAFSVLVSCKIHPLGLGCCQSLEAPETPTKSYHPAALWLNLYFLPTFNNNLLLLCFLLIVLPSFCHIFNTGAIPLPPNTNCCFYCMIQKMCHAEKWKCITPA